MFTKDEQKTFTDALFSDGSMVSARINKILLKDEKTVSCLPERSLLVTC